MCCVLCAAVCCVSAGSPDCVTAHSRATGSPHLGPHCPLQACLPVPSRLPAFSADADLADGAAAAWQLQVHACSLQIVVLEILAGPPDSSSGASTAAPAPAAGDKRGATSDGGSAAAGVTETAAAEAGREALLRALSPQDLMGLLLAVTDAGQQPQLLAQLSALLQVCLWGAAHRGGSPRMAPPRPLPLLPTHSPPANPAPLAPLRSPTCKSARRRCVARGARPASSLMRCARQPTSGARCSR
jgi:hypothetical protein